MRFRLYIFPVIFCLVISCQYSDQVTTDEGQLFEQMDVRKAGITFINELDYTEEFNTYTYRNFYNGGGVALGDINNDGLTDIYFTGNLVDNRLYLNKGNFEFEDITKKAGVACHGVWSAGASIADVNGDGWLDLYVCKSGPPGGDRRSNELFLNNGDLTFSEVSAKYGLHDEGLSTHACFFDYDNDGDLDFYLLNNSIRSVGRYDLREGLREVRDPNGGNKLYRNELINPSGTSQVSFTDVSEEAGIYGSNIGFGLGATVGDINRDGWQDIYVSNDFFEKDYLYLNKGDGTFHEALEEYIREISFSSMGADMADINNDGYPEIFVTDMLPWTERRLKTKTAFDNWDKYQQRLDNGYYRQFTRNVLQLNNGGKNFSEIGRIAGVDATDWSWGALVFDMDNDGWKDIFVANGIYKDLTDQDYVNFISEPQLVRQILEEEGQVIKRLIDSIPTEAVPNCAFRNDGTLRFTSCAQEWGLDAPGFSNGAAYADLDNDGDLDLVINNVNMAPFLYRNRSREQLPDRNFVMIQLKGAGQNTFGIGAQVIVHAGDRVLYQNHMPMKSYESTTEHRLLFGVGNVDTVDIRVEWNDKEITVLSNVPANQQLTIAYEKQTAQEGIKEVIQPKPLFTVGDKTIPFRHRENTFVDFDRDRLLMEMKSHEGPCLCKGDVNGDRREDIYIGGAKDQPGAILIQSALGQFVQLSTPEIARDSISEDIDCAMFDADGDGDLDLYVVSGGNEFPSSSDALADRLYLNNGRGAFTKSPQILPAGKFESGSCVRPCDYDQDGDIDLFVGTRLEPFYYGVPTNGYLLRNERGTFINVTEEIAPDLIKIGLITDATWADIDNDKDQDLLVCGEWMPVTLFRNEAGKFSKLVVTFEDGTPLSGFWNCVAVCDADNDSDSDFLLGNMGLNTRLRATEDEPMQMYVNDFDNNGTVEQIVTMFREGEAYPLILRQDLVMQIPKMKTKYLRFASYGEQTIDQMFDPDVLSRSIVHTVHTLESLLLINVNGELQVRKLNQELQLSPLYAFVVGDFNSDGSTDFVAGGNHYHVKPELGIYDASYGQVAIGHGDGTFTVLTQQESGVTVPGEIRNMTIIQNTLIIVRNNDVPVWFAY